jgi:hypothetical protein
VSDAPRKRGRPTGSRKVHPDRDRLIHFAVEWAILKTGLGIGRGVRDPVKPDACIIAAWLLSGGLYQSEYLDGDPNRAWLIEAAQIDAGAFQMQLAGTEDKGALLAQLRRVDHLTARRAYRSVQAATAWRRSMREDTERAERTRDVLAGKPVHGSPFMKDDTP